MIFLTLKSSKQLHSAQILIEINIEQSLISVLFIQIQKMKILTLKVLKNMNGQVRQESERPVY